MQRPFHESVEVCEVDTNAGCAVAFSNDDERVGPLCRPIDQLACTAFGPVGALVCRVEPLEDVPSARRRND